MRTLVVVVLLALAAVVSARSFSVQGRTISLDRKSENTLRSLIEKLAARATTAPPPTDKPECSNPCDIPPTITATGEEDNDEFFACAVDQIKKLEMGFNEIYKQKTNGDGLFSKEEHDIVWHLRTDWVISREMKDILEVVLEEIMVSRFMSGVVFEDFSDDEIDKLEEMGCTYGVLKEESYRRAYGDK